MSWLEQGEGTPVILLHGIPTSPELWRHVLWTCNGFVPVTYPRAWRLSGAKLGVRFAFLNRSAEMVERPAPVLPAEPIRGQRAKDLGDGSAVEHERR